MRCRIFLILMVALACEAARGQVNWGMVVNRSNNGDYEGIRNILVTSKRINGSDSVKWYYWMGVYYYWRSYEDQNCTDTACQMFDAAIQYKELHPGIRNVPIGECYLHLGEINYLSKDYKKGIANLTKALLNTPYSDRCPKNATKCVSKDPVFKGLGMCYAMQGDFKRALQYLNLCDSTVNNAYSAVRMKGKVYAMKGDDANALKCYNDFVSSIREIVRDSLPNKNKKDQESWWMSVRPFITDCWRLEQAAPELLYDVALITKGILLQQNSALGITSRDVQAALTADDVAVEWMVYEKNGKKQLGAVVLKPDGKVSFVHTATNEQVIEWSEDSYGIFDNHDCRKAIWSKEMMNAIGDAKNVYFAPDGILNQVGIEYMFPKADVRLYRLTSTRELLNLRRHTYASAAIFGDVDYDLAKSDVSTTAIDNDEEAYRYIKNEGMHVKKLNHSAEECDSIAAIRNNKNDTIVMGAAATERHFRSIAGGYNMLFISTHGYCRTKTRADNSDFPRRDSVDHSLSESGLLFCGYNAEQKSRESITDGIVSARELSNMDMRNVELCVVSACEGAQGRVSADGTYGIQRGLKAAGVDAMILSLWEVDDRATQVFMTYMYSAMADGNTLHEAFWQARERLKTHDVRLPDAPINAKPTYAYNDPYYYNAFVLIDVK